MRKVFNVNEFSWPDLHFIVLADESKIIECEKFTMNEKCYVVVIEAPFVT